MMNCDELDDRFGIEGEVGFAELENDLIFVTVSNKYADADICLYGAHITSFRPHRGNEMLWMSQDSLFEEGKAIRGGIPVCFPWFGPHPTDANLPQHGFARLTYWEVNRTSSLPNGETQICLSLNSSAFSKTYWPYDFYAELIFTIGNKLSVEFQINNTSKEAFSYSSALHSYFLISSIENIAISGLEKTSYHNQLDGSDGTQEEELLNITAPTTHHYYNTQADCVIIDPVFRRRTRIAKEGSKATTVWNPGEETCARMTDMHEDAFIEFVCVETVNAFEDTIHLQPGKCHKVALTLSYDDLSA